MHTVVAGNMQKADSLVPTPVDTCRSWGGRTGDDANNVMHHNVMPTLCETQLGMAMAAWRGCSHVRLS